MADLLTEALRTRLAPALRADGFTGSGQIYRRRTGDLLHVVQVQRSRRDMRFAINLGIQPADIPDVLGNQADRKRLTEAACEFRRRLSAAGGDQWWFYGQTSDEAMAAVEDAGQVYARVGRRVFQEQSGTDASLWTVTAENFAADRFFFSGFGSTKVRMARALALMRFARGQNREARNFAIVALGALGGAGALKTELETIVANAVPAEAR